MSDVFSVKEILDEVRKDVRDLLSNQAVIRQKLDDIVVQTTKTNGRVTAMETKVATIDKTSAVSATKISAIVAVLTFALTKLIDFIIK